MPLFLSLYPSVPPVQFPPTDSSLNSLFHRPFLRSDESRDYFQSATVSDNRQKTVERRRWRNSMEHRCCHKCRRETLSWLLNVALLLWAGKSRVPKWPRVTDGLKRLVKG